MPKFTATQYEHFKLRNRYLINKAVESIPEPEALNKDEKVSLVLGGKAKLNKEKLLPKDGSCPRHLTDFLAFWDFPGDSVRVGKIAAYNKKTSALRDKLSVQFKDMLDRYVVGVITGEEFIDELKKLEDKYVK